MWVCVGEEQVWVCVGGSGCGFFGGKDQVWVCVGGSGCGYVWMISK